MFLENMMWRIEEKRRCREISQGSFAVVTQEVKVSIMLSNSRKILLLSNEYTLLGGKPIKYV